VCWLEVDPSLWVFREIWAVEGMQSGIVASGLNPGEGLFY